MKVAAAFVMLAVLGFLAARASADTVPIPVPAPPKVTVPALPKLPAPVPKPPPVPLPPVPKPPAPVAPAPVPTPTPPAVVPGRGSDGTVRATVPSVQTPSVPGGSGGTASSSSSSTPSRGSGQSSSAAQVERLRTSSRWIGARGRRFTTITFVLPRAARVIFTVTQVSPVCKGVGHFTVKGHAGVNRLRFAGRFRGKPLAPGTYRIAVRTVGGPSVRRVTIVIVDGSAPSKTELTAARAANSCASGPVSSSRRGDLATQVTRSFTPEQHPSAIGASKGANSHSGVLASTAEEAARAIRPVLVALLAASILLLGLASLPNPAVPGARLNYLLAQHRLGLAGLGAVALVGVAIAFIIG